MNKNIIPSRGDFVDAGTYVDPGNFTFNEINDGDFNVAVFTVVNHLQNIRNALGHPMNVNSGYRNPVHNAGIGGAMESQHMYGKAADIAVIDFNGDGAVNGNMVNDPNFGAAGDDWAILANHAGNEGASFIEPWAMTGNWVHMNWR